MTPGVAPLVFAVDDAAGVRMSIQGMLGPAGFPLFEPGSLFDVKRGCSAWRPAGRV
jgi:hypothetical protein